MINQTRSVAQKYGSKLAAIPAVVLASVGTAHAALPAAVTTAISDAGTDMTTAVTAIITAFVVFWGLKKLASKFGWI
ncbi:major capsid protein [Acidovorax sp. 22279]|uniref:major capsid protein n=1 Tax=Acidovorax sp. 22279 TaxID=3453900 RepID=UPI003F87F2FC